MVINRKSKIMLVLITVLFLLILPNYANATKISVGKVKNVKVESQTTTSLKISWKSVSKVNGYKVYICDNSENKFKYYGKTTSKSMTIKKLKTSKEYKIKVRGYKTVKKKTYYGSYSSVLKIATKPTQVKGVKIESQTDSTITLNWNKVTRASGYRVYIYNSSKKKYEYYGYSRKNSITITDLKADKTYKIKVRAYKTVDGNRTFGVFSKIITAKTKISKIKNLKVESQTDTSINLSWSKISKATGYRVYKYNNSKKKYELYKDLKTNKITIDKLKSSEEYKFKVRAYKTVKKKNEYGIYSEVLSTATRPDIVKNIKVTSQTDINVSLKWDRVTRATGYKIYLYNVSKESYDLYSSLSENSIVIDDLIPATIYKIKINAYKQVSEDKFVESNLGEEIETFTIPSKVTNLQEANNTLTSIQFSWDKTSGASGYELYNYNFSKGRYEILDTITNNTYEVSNLTPATEYRFKVRAYITYKNKKYYGSYTEILNTSTLPTKVEGLKSTIQTSNSISIEWNKVDKANGYAIYVYNYTSQNYKLYKKTTDTKITIIDLDVAKYYKIYVKSYVVIDKKEYYSEESNIISQKTLSTNDINVGIDVSQHQGKIDWDKVKDQVDFAILRLGWIGNGLGDEENHTLDIQFERNYNECKRLGIPVGVYVYCYSNRTETAKSGANWTIKQLEGKTLELPVFIDMEDKTIAKIGKNKLSNICIEFNTIIEQANFQSGIYANRNWFDNYLNRDLRTKYTCWIAHYTNEEQNYDEEYRLWQYTSKGLIDGISGNVDLNIIYYEREEVV